MTVCGLHHVAVEVVRVDGLTGKRFTLFADPDGLPIELYEERCGRNKLRGPSVFLEFASDEVGDGIERGVGV